MPDTRVIANTSPLLYLHQVDCLDVLQQLYSTVVVPPAVRGELETGRKQGVDVPDVGNLPWIGASPVAGNEILTMVNIALGNLPITECLAGDANGDHQITVDEILTAVYQDGDCVIFCARIQLRRGLTQRQMSSRSP